MVPALACVVTGIAYVMIVPDDRHKAGKRDTVADVVLSPKAAVAFFGIYIVISVTSGLTFNTISIALPKIVDERLGEGVSLIAVRSEEHTSALQSHSDLVCRLLLEKKKKRLARNLHSKKNRHAQHPPPSQTPQ